jgi:hypothetical protein
MSSNMMTAFSLSAARELILLEPSGFDRAPLISSGLKAGRFAPGIAQTCILHSSGNCSSRPVFPYHRRDGSFTVDFFISHRTPSRFYLI